MCRAKKKKTQQTNNSNNKSKIQSWQVLPNIFRILLRAGREMRESNGRAKIDTCLIFGADFEII